MRFKIINLMGTTISEMTFPSLAAAKKEVNNWGWGKVKIQEIDEKTGEPILKDIKLIKTKTWPPG